MGVHCRKSRSAVCDICVTGRVLIKPIVGERKSNLNHAHKILILGVFVFALPLVSLAAGTQYGGASDTAQAATQPRQAVMRQATQMLVAGQPQRAAVLFEQAATQYGESVEAELGMVRAHLQAGAFREALSFAYLVSGEHADSAAAVALLAYIEDRAGQTERALARLKEAEARFADDPSLLAVKAEILIDRGAAIRAAAELDAWLAHHPAQGELHALRARAALALGDRGGYRHWQQRAARIDTPAKTNDSPLRPTPFMQPVQHGPEAEWNAGSGAIIDGGRRVVTLARIVAGSKGDVWVRNGLGAVRRAVVEALYLREGVAVLRLASPYSISAPFGPELMAEPAPGRACVAMGYAVTESPEPAYPALAAGLVFRALSTEAVQTTVAQTAGFRGAPVFDAHGRWLGLSLGPGEGAGGPLLRASAFRALLPKQSAAAGPMPAANPSFEELYERFMPAVVQVLAAR